MVSPTDLMKECDDIIPALKAWFDSQGINEIRQITVCGILLGEGIGNRATSIQSLDVSLTLIEMAIELGAKAAFAKKAKTNG